MKKTTKIFSVTMMFILSLCTFLVSDSKEINASNVSISTMMNILVGEYKGTYTNSSGQVGIYLKVYPDVGGKYTAILYTYLLSSGGRTGKYPMNASYNINTKQYQLTTAQAKYPNVVGTLSKGVFSGYFTLVNGIQYKFSVTKIVYQSQASTTQYLDNFFYKNPFDGSLMKFEQSSPLPGSYEYTVYKDSYGRYIATYSIFSGNQGTEIGSARYDIYYDISKNIYRLIGKSWIKKPATGNWLLEDVFIEVYDNRTYNTHSFSVWVVQECPYAFSTL